MLSAPERADLVTEAWAIAYKAISTADAAVRHWRRADIALAVHHGETDIEQLVKIGLHHT